MSHIDTFWLLLYAKWSLGKRGVGSPEGQHRPHSSPSWALFWGAQHLLCDTL